MSVNLNKISPPTPGKEYRVTDRMKAFADEYVSGQGTGKRFDIAAALDHAGYAETSLKYGYRMLRHPLLSKYIKKKLDEYAMSAEEVLARFSDIARANVGNILALDPNTGTIKLDPSEIVRLRHVIKSFTWDSNGNPKIEFHDAHQALRDIARVRGMMKDGLEVSGPGGGAVPVSMTVQFVRPGGEVVTPVQPQLPEGTEDEDWSDVES